MPQVDYVAAIGLRSPGSASSNTAGGEKVDQVNLLLMANGLPIAADPAAPDSTTKSLTEISQGFLESHAEQQRLLLDYRCPADRRIESFLAAHFADLKLP